MTDDRTRKLCAEYFEKDLEDMTLDEILLAISAVANRLGYKDMEDVSLQMLADRERGLTGDEVIAHAKSVAADRGYDVSAEPKVRQTS